MSTTRDVLVVNMCASGSPSCNNGSVGILLGKGDGTFQPVQTYSSQGNRAGPIAVSDVNGDGKPDLVVGNYYDDTGNYSDGKILVLLGNGDGTFQPSQTYDSGGVGAVSLALADVNGDGKLDLVVANNCISLTVCTSGGVAVLKGNGDGTFQPPVSYNSGRRTRIFNRRGRCQQRRQTRFANCQSILPGRCHQQCGCAPWQW